MGRRDCQPSNWHILTNTQRFIYSQKSIINGNAIGKPKRNP
jgi:hypothetical protein